VGRARSPQLPPLGLLRAHSPANPTPCPCGFLLPSLPLAVTRVLDGILERSERVTERDYRAAARGRAGEGSGSDTARSASSTSTAGSSMAGGARRRSGWEGAGLPVGGVGGAPSYPPMGPSAASSGGSSSSAAGASYPPAGPQPSQGGVGGLNLQGAPPLPRREKPERVPKDSLYHLLKSASQR
jgi:hypothetical protein